MNYEQLKKSKNVKVYIDSLKKYVKAFVIIIPYENSNEVFIKLKGSYNKKLDFEIHIYDENDFNKLKLKP